MDQQLQPQPQSQPDRKTVETGMGPITDRLINELINNIMTDQNKLVDPLTNMINRRIQPYIYFIAGLYVLIIGLLIVIIYILLNKKST